MEEMKAQPFLDATEALRQSGGKGKTFGGHETCPHLPPPTPLLSLAEPVAGTPVAVL